MNDPALPRQIWVYWRQGEAAVPPLVATCIDSWRRLNPDWRLTVLDAERADTHCPDLAPLARTPGITIQMYSDLLRATLLHTHGGVWVDATLLCARPLDDWLWDYLDDSFFAFASRRPDRLMTNWFLAGTPASQTLDCWRQTMLAFWTSHSFPEPGHWRRQLIRKLTSLRRRGLISNDAWFAHWLTRGVRAWPYPVNMYLFERALSAEPELLARWQARAHLWDTEPETIQNRFGMNAPVTPESQAFLARRSTPVHKLNWRQDTGAVPPGSNLAALLAQVDALAFKPRDH